MTTTQESQTDIVSILLKDHREANQLLDRYDADMHMEARDDLFREITTTIVRHEVAEEQTIYPALRSTGEQGERIADAMIGEHSEAEELLRSMEQMDVMSEYFEQAFHRLHDAILQHAQIEESEAFPFLRSVTSSEDRLRMGERYEHAKRNAPSHPHPHTPNTPPGNRIAGPITAAADRIRDAFRTVPGSGGQTGGFSDR